MADNIDITPGAGATVATDDVGGRHYQIVKAAFGADGTATQVDASNPLPAMPPLLTASGSGSALGAVGPVLDVAAYSTVSFTATGTFTGALRAQGSSDGTTWTNLNFIAASSPPPSSYNISNLAAGGAGNYVVPTNGYRYFRLAFTSYTSGTVNVTMTASTAPPPLVPVLVQNSSVSVTPPSTSPPSDGASGTNVFLVQSLGMAWNGASWDRLRQPNTYKSVSTAASGSTALWTPTSTKKFRLMRFKIDVSADASIASGGVLTVGLLDAAASIGVTQSLYVPATAGTTMGPGWSSGWIDLGNGVLSALANNVLNVNLSAALTSGTCRVIACGCEE